MKVVKLEVANFRGLCTKINAEIQPFQSLTFDPSFNVIIGINGIGKSSILDLLAILISRVLPRTTPAPKSYRQFFETDFRFGSSVITARVWLDFDGEEANYGITQATGDNNSRTEEIDKAKFRKIASQHDSKNPLSNVNTPIVLLYTTSRAEYRSSQRVKKQLLGRAVAYQDVLRQRVVSYRSIGEWLRAKRVLASDRLEDQRILGVIETALQRFLPAFGELEVDQDTLKLYVKKKGTRLGIEQLSDGERSFLAIVIDTARRLAQANPGLSDPLTEGKGILLIDELELHLHPKWQRTCIKHLEETFPGLQFITTTHSPFVIQSLSPGQLINLDPESYAEEYTDKSIEDITEDVMGVPMPQKSERYQEMMRVAEEYFRLLRATQPTSQEEKETLKRQLDELTIPFSDDPAYMALLKVERETILGTDDNAPS